MAYEEILIAEGSDWCWWYGPHHESANRGEFDQLFRDHLSNVYRLLGQPAPEELSRPILKLSSTEHNIRPASQITPVIDGKITSYFEWMGAGEYKVDHRQGAMHGGRSGLDMLYYGTCGEELYLRLDFDPMPQPTLLEIRIKTKRREHILRHEDFAALRTVEASVPLATLGYKEGDSIPFQLSLWFDSLPVEALPQNGWLEMETGEAIPLAVGYSQPEMARLLLPRRILAQQTQQLRGRGRRRRRPENDLGVLHLLPYSP